MRETKTSTEARDCQDLIRQLKANHEQIALQWVPGHCQISENEQADILVKKGAKIKQTHIRETSYHSTKQHLKQDFFVVIPCMLSSHSIILPTTALI